MQNAPIPARSAALAGFALIAAATSGLRESRSDAIRAQADSVSFVTTDSGNIARYRVRERLVGFELPNDAVGTTGAVTGALIIRADGSVSPSSRFVVDVRGLTSDQSRRDNFVRTRTLETATYPNVTLTVSSVGGLKLPLPASGPIAFDLIGNLTVRGVTKPSTWKVTGAVNGATVTGSAWTEFTFADFQITQPRVPIVLSVADTIRLEYDFRLVRK